MLISFPWNNIVFNELIALFNSCRTFISNFSLEGVVVLFSLISVVESWAIAVEVVKFLLNIWSGATIEWAKVYVLTIKNTFHELVLWKADDIHVLYFSSIFLFLPRKLNLFRSHDEFVYKIEMHLARRSVLSQTIFLHMVCFLFCNVFYRHSWSNGRFPAHSNVSSVGLCAEMWLVRQWTSNT